MIEPFYREELEVFASLVREEICRPQTITNLTVLGHLHLKLTAAISVATSMPVPSHSEATS